MFDPSSRYYYLDNAIWTDARGERTAYKRRRFIPQPEEFQKLAEWPVAQGDRFDVVAARTLGDPQEYWQLADANRVMDPDELTETPGRRLVVPMPKPNSAV